MNKSKTIFKKAPSFFCFALVSMLVHFSVNAQTPKGLQFEQIKGTKPRNVIFILSDDHRYDFMGFTGKVPGLQTTNMRPVGE